MKKFTIFVIAILTITLISCQKEEFLPSKKPATESEPELFKSALPAVPLSVQYVILLEFEAIKNGISKKEPSILFNGQKRDVRELSKFEYFEFRLLDLYPGVAYKGMAQDMIKEKKIFDKMIEEHTNSLKANGTYVEEKTYLPENVSFEEAKYMLDFNEAENNFFTELNNLANTPHYANINDFNNIKNLWEDVGRATLIIGYYAGPHVLVSVIYAYIKAKNRESAFYTHLSGHTNSLLKNNSGILSDAYRHVYVSAMLRKLITQPMSWFIMDVVWEFKGSIEGIIFNGAISWRDYYMDIHNNNVGRDTKYNTFHGSGNLAWHQYDFSAMGDRVGNFIEAHSSNSITNAAQKTWTTSTPFATILLQKTLTSNSKYIYYSSN